MLFFVKLEISYVFVLPFMPWLNDIVASKDGDMP